MSLGYSVMLLRSVLRDIVFLSTKVVGVVSIVHEMKLIHLESMNFSEREIQNNKKLHEIQLRNIKEDITNSIIRNFPKSFDHLVQFKDWKSMMEWMNKELKIKKEAK